MKTKQKRHLQNRTTLQKHLKHWFVPTRHNQYHPGLLRASGFVAVIALLLFTQLAYNYTTARQVRVLGYATNISTDSLHSLSNSERSKSGLRAFTNSSKLATAARNKANHMIANNYWAHTAPDGTTPWDFISGSGYSYVVAGENLAKGFNTSQGVVTAWMGSSSHRANVLSTNFSEVGYATVDGTLQGTQTTLVVAMYAKPTTQKASTAPAKSTPTPVSSTSAPTTTPEPATAKTPKNTAKPKPIAPTKSEEVATDAKEAATSTNDNDGVVEGRSSPFGGLTRPASMYMGLNWGQKVSLYIVGAMLLLITLKHTLIWRNQKRGIRHVWLRGHPIGQVIVLVTALFITIFTGVGAIL